MTQKDIEQLLEEKMREMYKTSEVYEGFAKMGRTADRESGFDEGLSVGLYRGATAISDVLNIIRRER